MESCKITIGTIPNGYSIINETHIGLTDAFGNCYIQLEYKAAIIEYVMVGELKLNGFASYKGHSNQPSNKEFVLFTDPDYLDVIYINKEYIGKEITIKYSGEETSEFVEFNYKKITHGPGSIIILNKLESSEFKNRFMKRLNGQTFSSFNLFTELNKITDGSGNKIVNDGRILNTCGQFPITGSNFNFKNYVADGSYWVPTVSAYISISMHLVNGFVHGNTWTVWHGGSDWGGYWARYNWNSYFTVTASNFRYTIDLSKFRSSNSVIEPKNTNYFMYIITL